MTYQDFNHHISYSKSNESYGSNSSNESYKNNSYSRNKNDSQEDSSENSDNTYENTYGESKGSGGVQIEEVEERAEIKPLQMDKLNANEDRLVNNVFHVYHVRALVCGSSGSGKTTFILNYLFQNLDSYGLVIYCAPTETLESGMIKSIVKNGKAVSQMFGLHSSNQNLRGQNGETLNGEFDLNKYFFPLDIRKDELPTITQLQAIQKKCSINRETGKPKRIALILDDFINVLTTKENQKQINAYLTQSSRASCDIFLLVQTYNHISPSIATNVNVLILFLKYMSKDSYNTCLRRSFTGSLSKDFQELIFNELKHASYFTNDEHKKNDLNHQPFIFINDQPYDRSIIFNNKYIYEN